MQPALPDLRQERGEVAYSDMLSHDLAGLFIIAAVAELKERIDLVFTVFAEVEDFTDMSDLTTPVVEATGLDNDLDGGGYLRAKGSKGPLDIAHHGHGLQTPKSIIGIGGVTGRHGATVAGGHGLKQGQSLAATDLPDDDSVRPKAHGGVKEVSDADFPAAFGVGPSGLQHQGMRLLKLEFRGVLDYDDAIIFTDLEGDAVEQGGLTATGTAGDDDIALHLHTDLDEFGGGGVDGTVVHQLLKGEVKFAEPPNGHGDTISGAGRQDHVDPASVGEAGVHSGIELIESLADELGDVFDAAHQVIGVGEFSVRFLQFTGDFNPDVVGAIDHDLADGIIVHIGRDAFEIAPNRLFKNLVWDHDS